MCILYLEHQVMTFTGYIGEWLEAGGTDIICEQANIVKNEIKSGYYIKACLGKYYWHPRFISIGKQPSRKWRTIKMKYRNGANETYLI